ncbi:zinc-dependent dehydrogenase [Gelria sp. Kuro-4]|uniref:zinc-dependent dehydrogenase n=1 Tax=Gelria sp. Kuro-4 TaxID=2796927 RepID=UPI001BED5CB3|nr:zinc-dependent dehydrogenase [Gelria sp. Kuro-4]BCV24889.1 alcohol dehydrogenase [Gelria sp. Kuro-4]
MNTMKAAVYRGIEDIVIEERPVPVPAPGEVILKVEACAICGTDVRIYYHGNDRLKPPIIIGHEIAGSVFQIGSGVGGLKVGDPVVVGPGVVCNDCHPCRSGNPNLCVNKRAFGYEYDGGFAEYVRIPSEAVKGGNLIRIPDNVSWEEASLAEPLSCCINGQKNLTLREGQTVVIYGAGPIGLMHMQLARMRGARVGIVDVSPERLALTGQFRPDFTIDSSTTDPVKEVLATTSGQGADVSIICCTAKKALEQALQCTCRGSKILFFAGFPKNDSVIALDANYVHYKEITLLGSFASTLEQMKLAIRYIGDGLVKVKPLITQVVSLDTLTHGIQAVRKQQGLKVVVKP